MGITYRHTQRSRIITALLGLVWIGSVVLALSVTHLISLAAAGLITVLLISFSSFTVMVQDDALRVFFGPGWIHRQIPLNRIRGVRVVHSPWYYGWGIRLTPRGWLWRYSGLEAVELAFEDGHHFLIGSDQPETLADTIRASL